MKISVSLPDEDVAFLDADVRDEGYPSRSAVVHKAVRLLRAPRLGSAYEAACREWYDARDANRTGRNRRPVPPVPPTVRRLFALIAFAIIAAACGDTGATVTTLPTLDSSSSDTLTTAAPAPQAAGPEAPLPESDYPDVVVADLAGGEVNLRELALGDRPTLLWFWAPH